MNYLLSTRHLTFALLLLFSIAAPIRAQVATFSGRVTDQNSGQGIADVAIVAQGNLTGTRVAISDVQGNYTLQMGANTNIKLRAYRTNFFFNPALAGFASLGGFPVSGTHSLNFDGTALPFPIFIFGAPILLTEDSSLQALTFDSVFHVPASVTQQQLLRRRQTNTTQIVGDGSGPISRRDTLNNHSPGARQNNDYTQPRR